MGNWAENIAAGMDKSRARDLAIQADEDRDRKIQADIVAAEYKKAEEAYLAKLRENQLSTQDAAAKAREKALKIEEANEKIAKGLVLPSSPIGDTTVAADGKTPKPYVGVTDFDVDAETEALVRLDEDGNVVEGGFLTDTEAKAEKERLAILKTEELEALANQLIEAEKARKKAEPDEKEKLNEEIAAIKAQIKSLEEGPSNLKNQILSQLDPEANLAIRGFTEWASDKTLETTLMTIDNSLTDYSQLLPWNWEVFLKKSEHTIEQLEDELSKWLGRGGGLSWGSKYTDSYANDWFQEYGVEELALFQEDPIGYYARNKEAIEEMSGKKYNIPSSGEIATVIADDPEAEAAKKTQIIKLQESLGIKSEELKKLKDDEGDEQKFDVFSTDKYKEGAKDIVTKYDELYADLQDATDERNEALVKKIRSQIINSPAHRLLNNQAFGEDVDVIVGQREELVKQFEGFSGSGQLELALTTQMAITTLDKQLWNKLVDKGILDLQSRGDGEILESAMSEHMGSSVRFQRRSDGNFHFFVDGELYQNPETKKEYWTQAEISSKVSYEVNEGFEKAQKEYLALVAKTKVEGMLTEEKSAEFYKAIIIQSMQDSNELTKQRLIENGAKFSPLDTESGKFIMAANGNYWTMNLNPQEIGDTGVTEKRFEKLDIPSSPTMLDISRSGINIADKSIQAWLLSLGFTGNAGLNTISSPSP
jgi:hypothetical protein